MNIEKLYQIFLKHPKISTDSRKIEKDDLFFALKGENFDGNKYAKQALDAGAAYCIIDNAEYNIDSRCIVVEDVLLTLQKLANFHRKQFDIPVIGVTGSNGKTTTKELISAVLQKKFNTLFTKGNLNNHIGVPLTLLGITGQTEIAVIEMGANHQGEIAVLSEIAEPTHGIITNVGKDHLEGFGSPEGVIKTKNELYQAVEKVKGTLFVNYENEILKSLIKAQTTIFYGKTNETGCLGKFIDANPYVRFQWNANRQTLNDNEIVSTHLAGSYNFDNLMAAACIGNYFGVDCRLINEALSEYKPVNNRSQLVETTKNKLLLDAYNANPSSMEAAIINFANIDAKNKVLILGDMLELGHYSENEHKKIVEMINQNQFLQTFLIGKEFAKVNLNDKEQKYIKQFDSIDDFCLFIKNNNLTGNFILLKGSRGIRLEKAVEYL